MGKKLAIDKIWTVIILRELNKNLKSANFVTSARSIQKLPTVKLKRDYFFQRLAVTYISFDLAVILDFSVYIACNLQSRVGHPCGS